ncbi:MAG TPA: T9SS type A sorting domain-containing protein [Bacteroidia bacterium]|nr:T9SS type A sorting domain-containing protein [Bacteroidia bacterium]
MENSNKFIKYLAFLFLLLFQFTNTIAQYGYFEQGYGTDRNEEGFDLAVTTDYKVMMAGYLQQGTNNKDVYILYTDSIGDTLWTKTVGGNNDDVAKAIWQKDASSFFIAGYTKPNGGSDDEGYFIKHDIAGNVAFSVAIGTADNDYFNDLAQSHEGNMVLVGYSNTLGTNKNIYVVKADTSSGTVLWSNLYGGSGHQEATAVLTKVNGNIVITGTDYSGGLPQAFLLELDSSGNQLTYQLLAQTFSSYANSIAMTRNGKYWLAGYTDNSGNTDALIALVDGSGIYESHQTYGGSNDDKFNSIIRIGNALFMAGSTASYGEGASDLYFVAADSVGNLLFDEYGGGTSTDYANAMFHRNGLLYVAGYNSSFGVTESGNMYAARFNVYELAGVIQSTNDLQTLLPIPDDCTMPRILYSDKMIGNTDTTYLNTYDYTFCGWCTGSTINESEITNPTSTQYTGIIGNPYRENELLEFCQTHQFNYIYFYGSAYLFTKRGFDINTNYTVNLTGGGSQNLITYLNEKLYNFIVRAKLNYGVQHVGIAGGDLPNVPHVENIFFRTGDFNSFQSSLQNYNYKYTGKIGQIVLEDEFWRSNDDLSGYSQTDTLFDNHKLYIKRMLTVARNDFNIRSVDDYIGRLLGDGLSWYQFDSCTRANANVKGLIQQRASELEELKDSLLNRKRLNRIFMVYTTATRYPTNKEQTTAPWFSSYNCHNPGVSHCECPDLFNDIGGVDNDCYEDSILPSLPWHNLYTSYNTMMFGHRNKHFYAGDSITRVFPIFYAEAGCLDDSLRLMGDTSDNFLGYWLATPKTGQNRTLKRAEELFRDNFPSNFYYNDPDRGPNMRLNGFVYFHYQLLKRIHRYNLALGQQLTNFSDNNATPRIEQDTAFSDNVCFWNIPLSNGGLYGELGPGKVSKMPAQDEPISYLASHPNPTASNLYFDVHYSDKALKAYQFDAVLLDAMGKIIKAVQGQGSSGNFSTSELPSGVYYLKCVTFTTKGTFTAFQRIIIMK